jgi:hypothetical protein
MAWHLEKAEVRVESCGIELSSLVETICNGTNSQEIKIENIYPKVVNSISISV